MKVKCRRLGLAPGRNCSGATFFAVFLLVFALAGPANGSADKELIGTVTRAQVEQALGDWVGEAMMVEPNLDATERFLREIVGAEVVVYLGTWCADTRRELGRLWRALDSLGVDELPELSYVAVDRGLSEPAAQLVEVDLLRVPTIVVWRQGREQGRIVERSPHGIEIDLLALLTGESTGTLTGSHDLSGEEADSKP